MCRVEDFAMMGMEVVEVGMRFRKSINLGGGFRLNFSKSGIGYSWGVPGFRITKTAKGTVRKTTSIPGTGIFWMEEHKVDKRQKAKKKRETNSYNYTKTINSHPQNREKKSKSVWFFAILIFLLFLAWIASIFEQPETETKPDVLPKENIEVVDSEVRTAPPEEHEIESENVLEPEPKIEIPEPTVEIDLGPGATADNPIALTADGLLDAVEGNIDEAKDLYVGEWLQLTGKVVSVTHNEIGHYTRTDYGKTTSWTTGEVQYTIEGVTIKSALIYWLAVNKRFERADIVVEMDTSLCIDPEKDAYIYYPQHSTVTVVAYCAAIGQDDVVLTDGRYPPK